MVAMDRDRPGVDRLSLLPDDIICHILSFLPTKDAIVTSAISKSYRYLFASIPNIDLDYRHFWLCYGTRYLYPNNLGDERFGYAEFRLNKFMNETLISRSRINELRIRHTISVSSAIHPSLVNSWIIEAIKRHLQMLDIGKNVTFSTFENPVFLPNDIYHCRTLVSLNFFITREMSIKAPEIVDLPNLKVLRVNFEEDANPDSITESLHNLFPGCPVLEDLHIRCLIRDSWFSGVHVLHIFIPSLRRLKIYRCCRIPEIIVDAPNLLHFDYISPIDSKIEINNLNSLVDACVIVSPTSSQSKGLPLLMAGISRVKSLCLEVSRLRGWFVGDCSFPKFPMLKHLELYGFINDYRESLYVILDSTPALEFLVVDLDYKRYGRERIEFQVPLNAPICLSQCLKEVEFRNFYGHHNDFELVQYILQYGEALTRITICPSKKRDRMRNDSCSKSTPCCCYSRSTSSVCQELQSLTMSSKLCKMVLA